MSVLADSGTGIDLFPSVQESGRNESAAASRSLQISRPQARFKFQI
jgi:hypothetical protein